MRIAGQLLLAVAVAALCRDAAASGPDGARLLARLTYCNATADSVAVQIDRRGYATAMTRDRRLSARFGRAHLEAVCPSLYDGTLANLSQIALADEVQTLSRVTDLRLPPLGDRCRLELPTQTGTVPVELQSPAVFANRFGDRGHHVAKFESLRQDFERLRSVTILGGFAAAERITREASARTGTELTISDLTFADLFGDERTAHFRSGQLLVMVSVRGDDMDVTAFEVAAP